MVLKVFGSALSTCTARVLACLEEIGAEYELISVDLPAGEHKRPPHTDRNPFGKVPALQDDDLVLFESRVINRYLVRKYGMETDLLKEEDSAGEITVYQWMEVETQQFNGPTSALVYQHLIYPIFYGSTADEKAVAEAVEKLGKVLDVYEARLSKSKFLAGDFYSLADLHHLTYSYYLITGTPHGCLVSNRPHVKAWWEAICARPASQKAISAMTLTRPISTD